MGERSTFHGSYAWKKARRVARIAAGHQCARCGLILTGKGELHVHHRKPVKRAPALELEPLNFMVVCSPCHNALEPRNGAPPRLGCNVNGDPLDPAHPWWNARP
jgi:5-methylcytosine-specific restriction endonuclease McrA